MKYIEVEFTIDGDSFFRDMLVDTLGNEGPYESFVETPQGMKAYVKADEFDREYLASTVQAFPLPLKYKVSEMEDRNWNEEWERHHEAVLVRSNNGSVWIRAPFHPHRTDVDYELIIEPKMSFGTAHHPTTYMMVSYVSELDISGRRVLDMGCGTAVLAILAALRGATTIDAVDIDEWAYRNAMENAAVNHANIRCIIGDASVLSGCYDVIFANINRNILLHDMQRYVDVLAVGGRLLISGFYQADEGALIAHANSLGLIFVDKKTRDNWSALQFVKK